MATIAIVAATAWFMGPSGRGEIAFAQATATTIAIVGGWGFYVSAASTRQAVIPRQYFDLTLGLTATIAIVVAMVALLAPSGLLRVPIAIPVGFAAVMTAGTTYCQRIAQARVSDLEYMVIGSIAPLVSLATVLPAVLLGATPGAVVYIWALGTSLGFLVAVSRTRRAVPSKRATPLDLRGYLRSGFAVGAANVSGFVVLRADLVILGLVSTAVEVGHYSVAAAMSGLLLYGAEVFALRTISSYGNEHDPAAYLHGSFRRARRAALLAAALGLPFVVAGWAILRYGFPEFQPAFGAFVILCSAAIPASFLRVLVSAASMLSLRRLLTRYSAACFALVLLYLPAAFVGATALAWASLVVYSAQAGFVAIGIRNARRRGLL